MTQIPSEHINKEWLNAEMLVFSNLAEPLDDPCGTLGFRGTPVEKHCSTGTKNYSHASTIQNWVVKNVTVWLWTNGCAYF